MKDKLQEKLLKSDIIKDVGKKVKDQFPQLKKSIDVSFNRIKLFHSKQKFFSFKYKDKFKNELSYNYSPIEKVGVYVPGGTASYPSTVLMNCIPRWHIIIP